MKLPLLKPCLLALFLSASVIGAQAQIAGLFAPLFSDPVLPKKGGIISTIGLAKFYDIKATYQLQMRGYYTINKFLFLESGMGGGYSEPFDDLKVITSIQSLGLGVYKRTAKCSFLVSTGLVVRKYRIVRNGGLYDVSGNLLTENDITNSGVIDMYLNAGMRYRLSNDGKVSLLGGFYGFTAIKQAAREEVNVSALYLVNPASLGNEIPILYRPLNLIPTVGVQIEASNTLSLLSQLGYGIQSISNNKYFRSNSRHFYIHLGASILL